MAVLKPNILPSSQMCGLIISVAGLFLMGGSSRSDVQSLAFLNPALILCCAGALLILKREQLQDKKWFFVCFLLIFLLLAFYAAPWPISVGEASLAEGNLQAAWDAADASRLGTLTGAPATVWQSLFFLSAPLAVFLFALQLDRGDLRLTVPFITGMATISGILGVLQIAGNPNGPLYLYRITNYGSAVGLFANRNHAAVLLACIFPMLALIASKSPVIGRGTKNVSKWMAIAVAVLLVPLILVTGSRSGMLAAVIGLIGGTMLYSSGVRTHQERKSGTSLVPLIAVTATIGLVFTTIYFSRAEAIDRIFAETNGNDRADFWTSSLQMFWQYFPFGFGPGGFVPAFLIDEPRALLGSAYLNRLHNDWLETALTFGVPGILLMLAGIIYYIHRLFVLWVRMSGERSAVALGRMASIVIAILAIASLSDYPLRTPAMAGFAALVLVWFAHARYEPNPC